MALSTSLQAGISQTHSSLDMLSQEIDGCLERALFPRLYLRFALHTIHGIRYSCQVRLSLRQTYHVAPNGKPVRTSLPIRALVPRRILSVPKQPVGHLLLLGRELRVHLARVDQDWVRRLGEERLRGRTPALAPRPRTCARAPVRTSKSAGTCSSDGCETAIAVVTLSSARSTAQRPPKQYPVAPSEVTPWALRAAITLLSGGRVAFEPCLPTHAGKSKLICAWRVRSGAS